MKRCLCRILVVLSLLGVAGGGSRVGAVDDSAAPVDPQDLEVIAVLEILENWDMVEALDMYKEMPYLIGDKEDAPITE